MDQAQNLSTHPESPSDPGE